MHKRVFIWMIASIVYCLTAATIYAQGWELQTNPLASDTLSILGKVQFVSSTEGWIAEGHGRLLHTTNAGADWSVVTPFSNDTVWSLSDPCVSMSWAGQNHGWKINWMGTNWDPRGAVIHKTSNGGATWEKKVLSTAVGAMGIEVQFVDTSNGWALVYYSAGDSARTMRSTDGGDSWDPVETMGIFHFVDANNGWAFGTDSIYHYVARTSNAGTNWSVQYVDSSPGTFNAIQFTDLNNGWVVGDSGKIIKTTDGGINWTPVTNTGIHPASRSKCLYFLNANTGWIGTNDGIQNENPARVILYTNNGGTSWTKQSLPIASTVFSIFFWDASNGWYTGEYGDSLGFSGIIGYTTTGGTGVTGQTSSDMLLVGNLNLKVAGNIIKYQIPTAGRISLKIYNLLGQEVRSLANEVKNAGSYQIGWNGRDDGKRKVSSGVYIVKLQSGSQTVSAKIVVVK